MGFYMLGTMLFLCSDETGSCISLVALLKNWRESTCQTKQFLNQNILFRDLLESKGSPFFSSHGYLSVERGYNYSYKDKDEIYC